MSGTARRGLAWALLALTLGGLLVAVGWRALDPPAEREPLPDSAGPVVLVGIPGLTWDLISPERTPALAELAQRGSAALVVRGVDRVTCPAQGWLTLGTGQRAGTGLRGDGEGPTCTAPDVAADGTPSEFAQWQTAADGQRIPAALGTLADTVQDSGGCVAAYGPNAALGAADRDGRVTAYRQQGLTELDGGLDPACGVHLIAAPVVFEGDRSDTLAETDSALGRLRTDLPDDATLIVAGLADTTDRAELHTLLVDGTAIDRPAVLSSSTTRQPALVQTTDLTATVLHLVGADVPDAVAGAPIGFTHDLGAVQQTRDLATAGTWASYLVPWIAVALAPWSVVLLGLGTLLRGRRHDPATRRVGATVVALAGTATMAVPAAAFLAGLVPWWRAGQPFFGLYAVVLGFLAALVALAWAGPWRRDPRGPVAVIGAVTVLVLGVDVILGGPLGLVSWLGVQPREAGRFYGMGNVGFGAISAAGLLLAGCLASLLLPRRRAAVVAVVLVGLAVVVVDGAPAYGADFGGVPAMAVATGVLALGAAGLRLSPMRIAGLLAGSVLLAGAVMVLDWLRPETQRSHLGDFVQAVLDGQAWGIVTRKLGQTLSILVDYPASWLAMMIVAVVVWAVADPTSVVGRPVAGLWQVPLARHTAWALIACWALGWALNDSGIALVGMGLTVAIGAGLAVLARARAYGPTASGAGPGGRRGTAWPGAAEHPSRVR